MRLACEKIARCELRSTAACQPTIDALAEFADFYLIYHFYTLLSYNMARLIVQWQRYVNQSYHIASRSFSTSFESRISLLVRNMSMTRAIFPNYVHLAWSGLAGRTPLRSLAPAEGQIRRNHHFLRMPIWFRLWCKIKRHLEGAAREHIYRCCDARLYAPQRKTSFQQTNKNLNKIPNSFRFKCCCRPLGSGRRPFIYNRRTNELLKFHYDDYISHVRTLKNNQQIWSSWII